MTESVRVLFSEEEIQERIRALGEKISLDFAGKTINAGIGVIFPELVIESVEHVEDVTAFAD